MYLDLSTNEIEFELISCYMNHMVFRTQPKTIKVAKGEKFLALLCFPLFNGF